MRFSLRAVLYATAHVSIALAAFGVGGIFLSALVIAFWAYVFSRKTWPRLIELLFVVMILTCGAGLLLPAVGTVRESARLRICRADLRQIALGMHAYREQTGAFPPANIPDPDGQPMHSWRILILPYIESSSLYAQYDFNEPWDGPNNRKLIAQMPWIYACPSGNRRRGQTDYFVVTGSAAFPHGERSGTNDLRDQSLLLIESRVPNVAWTEPRDLTYAEALAALTSPASPAAHVEEHYFTYDEVGFNIAVVDTSSVTIFNSLSEDDAKALLSAEGVGLKHLEATGDDARPRRLRWPRIIFCSLLALLTFWPLAYCLPRKSPNEDSQ